jgi:hypothetical protein
MQYIKIDNNTWAKVDGENTSIIKKLDVENEITFNEDLLEKLPIDLTDEEKITWYNAHVDEVSNSQSRMLLQVKLDELTTLLGNLT